MKANFVNQWPEWIKNRLKRGQSTGGECSYLATIVATVAVLSSPYTVASSAVSHASDVSNVSYVVNISNDWGSGYCAVLTVTNQTSAAVTWHMNTTVDGTVSSLWNGTWSQSGSSLSVAGSDYNRVLPAGQSNADVGFCVTRSEQPSDGPGTGTETDTDTGSEMDTGSDYPVPANDFAENGGVEYDLKNWSTTAGTLTRSTEASHSGVASALITNRTAGWHGVTFNVGTLTDGNDYDVAVWVKLAPGSVSTAELYLTAKRMDDADPSTTEEYERVATAVASADQWVLLHGVYTHHGTAFEHFIIESDDAEVSYYVDDFSIGGDVAANSDPDTGSSNHLFVGNITTSGRVRSDFTQYWDQITPENEGKWGSVEGTRGVYNWSGLDAAYNYAKQNGMPFKQHTLVWGSQYPAWIESLQPAEQAAEIEEWIHDFCARYPDVDIIDVVNEATPGHAPAAFAKSAFGDDWIIQSFKLARKYCPNATLVLNDYNVLSWNTDAFLAMAKPVVDAGVVDAIGLQSHGLEDRPITEIKSKLDKVAALGLPIYISEYDIAKTDDQAQLDVMKTQFPVFYKHPSVAGITLWGYVVGTTWRDGTGLIQSDGTPRPAMTWLMNYLKEQRGSGASQRSSCDLPTSFSWTSTAPLIVPHNQDWASIKDPTVVRYNGKYHVFASIVDKKKHQYGGVYLNFSDWSEANTAEQFDMSQTNTGDTVAPEVFYFKPHNKWYLIYQWGAKYSTNTDISNPSGWTVPKPLIANGPDNGIDYWVICDATNCHLFFSGDDGKLYHSKVSLDNFPKFENYDVVMSDDVGKLFEASNVYKVAGKDQYLLLVEAYNPRYFRSWTANSLDGPWTPLADTQSNPFAGAANVTFSGTPWTQDISHGEMIRDGYDQTLTINPCEMKYLYQGRDPASDGMAYDDLPYQIGLLEATH